MARIVFMGTPGFAVPTLDTLADAHLVVGVVTQPDRPAGRGREVRQSAVKRAALQRDLPLYQPRSLRTPEAMAQLARWAPDVIVVVSFGQLLSQDVLDLPPYGCLNVHASLLPRWRGAAPVAAAILAGDEVTGATIMKLDAGMDTGPILAQREEPIRADDTRVTLMERLSYLGAELLAETLPAYLTGDLQPEPQSEGATFAHRLRKEDGQLDWSQPAVHLDRRIRAFTPWPGTFTFWRGRRLKVLEASPLPHWTGDASPGTVVEVDDDSPSGATHLPGTVVGLDDGSPPGATHFGSASHLQAVVATGKGALRLERVQLAGKRAMAMEPFLRGHQDFVGSQLG
jgi:methionyl-tRNA formyltransferase